ncbi:MULTISPECIES: ATP-binding protein [Pseudomonas aeruginosa group]|uniref:two-component system sensor histidine kinase TtsS n=1 Tax=Pseudomonas aeruginosa group TaxID=136841 RepID=UPI0006B2A547|nr:MULTISPECIES: transporter substrate-binding domain-containing protein [Pseudomonas aeruginosa group]KQB31020.1 histidine kinase [Pseudomonas paraeruginosa]MDT1025357.1 transporter substrate-binding domain-containing protein [Pseudomonas paraeruginosa]PHJ31387.1 hybrid sensor histidine kinase/response regulator [Pseudomonas paraeruginosa]QQV49932.1 transporter substrate-binding domain-containing protein [Pseudomonas aeruginosa]RQF86588.1 hybrid sensor histidine kinase/response regulator [Pse
MNGTRLPPGARRGVRLLARLALCILASLPWQAPQASAAAQAQPASLAQLLRMRQNLPERPLRVAQVAHPPGQQESNGSRILNGISDDYLQLIGDFLALPLERITYPSVEASFAGLRNGEVDLLPRASDFERHLPGLIFSHPYLNSTPIIIGRSDDQSLPPDLQGKRVLLLNHYLHPDTVRQAYPGAILESVRGTAAGLQRLVEGGADAFLGDKTRANRYMLQRPDLKLQNKFAANLPSEGFAFAALASRRDLVTLVDHVLETTPDTRKHEFLQRWTPSRQLFAPTDAFALSHGEREWLKKKQPLRLIAQSAPPYFFRNSHGQWDGLGLDVLRYLSDAYELPLEILDAQSPAQDQRRLERGEALLASSIPPTPERRRRLAFSMPFGVQDWAFVIRRHASSPSSLEAMAGRRLAIADNHPLRDYLENRYPRIDLVLTASGHESFSLVESGEVDATLQSIHNNPRWLQEHGLRQGEHIEATPTPQVFALAPGHGELLGILDKLLGNLAQDGDAGSGLRLMASGAQDDNLWQHLPEGFWHALLLAAVIILLSLLWNWRLKKQVQQRRIAQNQLRDQLAFQFSLLNGLPTPLYVRDLEGRLSTCNRAYEQFFASSLEEMRGTTPSEQGICPPSLARTLEFEYGELLQHRQPRYLDCCIEVAGEAHQIYQWLVPFYNARGKLQGLLGGWIDISERKRLETQLRDARQAAMAASAAKGQFLASMSHELRTPLNALVGLLELEGQRAPSENLRIAQRSASSMIDLIGNILDLDKIESGQMQLAPQPTDLGSLLSDSLELFVAQARQRNLALELDCSLPAQRRYRVDPLRLRQVLYNLLSNALKFTEAGRVRLSVAEHPQEDGRSLLAFRVSDTGIGIPRELQPRLLEPYRQAHADTALRYGGSGLGLSICSQLVQLMGARLWLDSEPGQGCAAGFELSLEWLVAGDAPLSAAPAGSEATGALKVLIVDDVSTNGLVLRQQLAKLGHDATFVCSGEDALDAWERERYDLLISDCNMPGMDGYDLTRCIRERDRQRGLPRRLVIGYSASALAGEAERCRDAGMDELMIKPVTLGRLREVLAGVQPARAVEASREAPGAGFDLGHVQDLAGADPDLLNRLLVELRGNLREEQRSLRQPVAATAVDQLVHRLSGLACTIDAPGLIRACLDLEGAVQHGEAALQRQQAQLLAVIGDLLADVERQLDGTPAPD